MSEIKLNENRATVFSETPPFPKNMLMELTNACNHRCVFCGNHQQKRKIVRADKELFFSIMEEAHKLGTNEIGFYMNGEPLLEPEICDYVQKAHELGFEYIYLTTNGVLLTKDLFEELVSAGLSSIKFSINAACRDTYIKIHGRDDFGIVKSNIETVCRTRKENDYKLPIYISFIHNRFNHEDIDELYNLFGELVDEIYVFDVTDQGSFNKSIGELLLDGQSGRFVDWPCHGLFNRIHVTSEGYLDACCVDFDTSLAVEDLRTTSLRDAWHSIRFRNLRKKHLEKTDNQTRCFYCMQGVYAENVVPINERLYSK